MIEEAGHMQTIAQISVALAGFAGVIAAFSKFRIDPRVVIYRVKLMVVVGLLTALFSLLPFVPLRFGVAEADSWRLSAAVIALVVPLVGLWVWIQVAPLYKARLIRTQALTFLQYVIIAALTIALLACAILGLTALTPAVYMATLFFNVAMCSYYFVMLINAVESEKT